MVVSKHRYPQGKRANEAERHTTCIVGRVKEHQLSIAAQACVERDKQSPFARHRGKGKVVSRTRPHSAELPTCERAEGIFRLLKSSCRQAVADVVQGTQATPSWELERAVLLTLASRRMQELRNDAHFLHGVSKPRPGSV